MIILCSYHDQLVLKLEATACQLKSPLLVLKFQEHCPYWPAFDAPLPWFKFNPNYLFHQVFNELMQPYSSTVRLELISVWRTLFPFTPGFVVVLHSEGTQKLCLFFFCPQFEIERPL